MVECAPVTNPAPAAPRAAFARTGLGIYPVLVTLFCCLLLLSNIAATKGIEFGPFLTDGGVFLFPLTYVLGDVLSEVYGLKATRRAILLGFLMSLLASLTFWLVTISPSAPGFDGQDAFARILGVVPQILLASVAGYLVGEFLNSYVLVKIKEKTKEKHLWARLIGSTVVGEFGDTLIFCLIAGPVIGITSPGDLLNYTLIGFAYKTAVEIILLPITYRVIAAIKKREPTYAEALRELESTGR
ncbi:queuosine precursor transporter [Nakamurella alba]|uniref:queuosine precursor transporter n=1 Tax=Nakamurella alba TaxID=2665158 RepID=UPI0012B84471